MSLWTRITEPAGSEVKIPIHGFMAAVREWQAGEYTRAQVISTFNLSASEETELDALKTKFQAATDKKEFMQVFKDLSYLAELHLDYATTAQVKTRLDLVP